MFFIFKEAFEYANGCGLSMAEFISTMDEVIIEARKQMAAATLISPIGEIFDSLQEIQQAADMGNPYTMKQIRELIRSPLAELNEFINE
jgi:hypothetical protein